MGRGHSKTKKKPYEQRNKTEKANAGGLVDRAQERISDGPTRVHRVSSQDCPGTERRAGVGVREGWNAHTTGRGDLISPWAAINYSCWHLLPDFLCGFYLYFSAVFVTLSPSFWD